MNSVLLKIGVVLFYLVVWLVTRYFYRRHKPEILKAVDDGCAGQSQVAAESEWFRFSSLWVSLMAFVGVFIPQGWWLVGYIAFTTTAYLAIASFNESMIRSEIRKASYEPESSLGS